MKFEDIQWKKGGIIQDSKGKWWLFKQLTENKLYPLGFQEINGIPYIHCFTSKGWYFYQENDDVTKLHLLPETYQNL